MTPDTDFTDELRTFAKKIIAGKKATTDWRTGIEFLRRIPGWKVQEFVGALPLKADNNLDRLCKLGKGPLGVEGFGRNGFWRYNQKGLAKGLSVFLANLQNGTPDRLYDYVPLLKERIEVVGGKGPSSPREGVVYAERFEVKDIDPWVRNSLERTLDLGAMWVGTNAATVTAADGSSVVIFDEPKAKGDFGAASFYTWANKHGLVAAAKPLGEGLEPSEEEQDRERLRTLDETGICAVCLRRQKMHHVNKKQPLLFEHGYQIPSMALRQGWAPRQGSCFGTSFPPFEVSPRGAVEYLEALRGQLSGDKESLRKAKAAKSITELKKRSGVKDGHWQQWEEEVEYTPASPEWREKHTRLVEQCAQMVARTEQQIRFYEKRIAQWARTDTYDEKQAGARFYSDKASPVSKSEGNTLLDEAMRRLKTLDDE